MFFGFYWLLHVFMPSLQWHVQYFRYPGANAYQEPLYVLSMILCFLGMIVTQLAYRYLFQDGMRISLKYKTFELRTFGVFFVSASCIFATGVAFGAKQALVILSVGFENYMADRISFGVGGGIKLLLAHWMYVSVIVFFFGFKVYQKFVWPRRLCLLMATIAFCCTLLYYGLNSNRNSVFILLLNLIVVWRLFVTPEDLKATKANNIKLVLLLSVMGLFFAVASSLRYDTHPAKGGEDKNVAEKVVKTLNGGFGNHENIVWLLHNPQPLLYGTTYVAAFANLIPRSFWPEKPVGGGPVIKNMIWPGSYQVGRKGNSSLTTGFFTEGLMNFGYLGFLIVPVLWSLYCKLLATVAKNQSNPLWALAFTFLFLQASTAFMYGEFLGFFARVVLSVFPVLVIAMLMSAFRLDDSEDNKS